MVFTSKTIYEKRIEKDSFGPIVILAYCYYRAEAARSMKHFNIDQMPLSMIKAFGLLKTACAIVNIQFGLEE
ncbi:unnamed protein product [Rotaria sordida]|uniref:Uncharacterized protein n=1 Tax=Rotaria sordida TaxID=392033 RepID=A0A814SMX6_9BILA|nr:unnamed protein product [Rotaria sordida]CAF1375460.1 unnamed protein product [Rotaria sordida]CAF3709293.1 unnamed protein product [Rotaria sordida]